MPSGKNIYKVLVAGANDKTFALLQTLLPGSSYEPPMRAGSAGEAKRMVMDCATDIAILNAPMRDEFGANWRWTWPGTMWVWYCWCLGNPMTRYATR